MKNRQCSHQISHVTAAFILLVNGFWEVKDDLVFPRRGGSKDNEQEAGKRKDEKGRKRQKGWRGKTESARRGLSSQEGESVMRSCLHLPESYFPKNICDPALTVTPTFSSRHPSLLLSSHKGASLFVLHAAHAPTSGPLHLLFPLPQVLFARELPGSLPLSLQVSTQMSTAERGLL